MLETGVPGNPKGYRVRQLERDGQRPVRQAPGYLAAVAELLLRRSEAAQIECLHIEAWRAADHEVCNYIRRHSR